MTTRKLVNLPLVFNAEPKEMSIQFQSLEKLALQSFVGT